MKAKNFISLFAAVLLLVPLFLIPGAVSFAEEEAEESLLLFSSFEEGEKEISGRALGSSNVKPASYGIKGKGLPVLLSTIEGSVDFKGNENKFNLFDAKNQTKFLTEDSYVYVSFSLERAATVTSYEIVSANDAEDRDPKSWTLYASVNGVDYQPYDTQKNVTFTARYQTKKYEIAAPAEYKWFKIVVTENRGSSMTQFAGLELYASDAADEQPGEQTLADEGLNVQVGFGPSQTKNCRAGAWTGLRCLEIIGEQTAKKDTRARAAVYEGLNLPVAKNTVFSYYVFPGLFDVSVYDYEYTPCRVILDLHFTDGTVLSDLGAEDQHSSVVSPSGQVAGECLNTAQWNYVESRIGEAAAGKTIDRIDVFFEMPEASKAMKFMTFFDDVKLENKNPIVYEHLSDYINILRGTNNDGALSRGLCTPGVTMPNGFNFYSPVTDPAQSNACYNYMVNGTNNPLDSISVMHTPSHWLGAYGTWQFMANTSVDGSGEVTGDMISSTARRSKFTHENEIARAHYYSVTLNEGTAASGVKIEVTPTSHAAIVRFTFPEDAENVNIIFDSLWGSGSVNAGEDMQSFSGATAQTSAGANTMQIYGTFDRAFTSYKKIGKTSLLTFPKGTTVLTMKIATSFLRSAQAVHNYELEIGDKTFDEVFAEAQGAWDALCGKFEIEGASYAQLVDFYSCLYRLYAYPMLYSENEGTNEEPVWVYASPYKSGRKTKGILYTVNGFWDTYRTTWAAYSLFTEEKDGEMLDGLVQHYIDSGWLPRWICPGGVDCMVGTSSDIIFADAYIKGVNFNYEKAWESMVENASAYSANMSAGGRPDNHLTPFLGYVANTTTQGFCSSTESYINDYGLYRMAEKMGLTAEAEYYKNRCLKYPELFNSKVGFFMGKSLKGTFSASAGSYDPTAWGGPKEDYTESVGWVNAFPAVFDGEGLVALYGGREALAAKLNQLFDDSPASMRKVATGIVHEADEFKEVKMGQYEHNNQPAHHLIYTYAFSSEPWRVQQYTREVLRHVYAGSELGQGYPGDEDNGEMSGWYIFNALGFYPYALASGEYVIGSPLYDKVTVHLDNGKDLTIIAHNNSKDNVYIQSATVNGQPYDKMYLTHETLTSGATIVYEMGAQPSAFGSGEDCRPSSLSKPDAVLAYKKDLTDGAQLVSSAFTSGTELKSEKAVYTDVASAEKLFDGNSTTDATVADGAVFVFAAKDAHTVSTITLSSAKKSAAPKKMTLEASADGENWEKLYENKKVSFLFDRFVVPFAVPEEKRDGYRFYRLTLGAGKLSEIELIGVKGAPEKEKEPIDDPVPSGDPEPSSPQENEPADPGKKDTAKKTVIIISVIAGVAVAAAAAAAVVLIVKKKKRS